MLSRFRDEWAFGCTDGCCLHDYLEIKIKHQALHNLLPCVHQFWNKYKQNFLFNLWIYYSSGNAGQPEVWFNFPSCFLSIVLKGKQRPSNSAWRCCSGPGWARASFLCHTQGLRDVLGCRGVYSSPRGLCWVLLCKHGIWVVLWISASPEYWAKFPPRFWVESKLSGSRTSCLGKRWQRVQSSDTLRQR